MKVFRGFLTLFIIFCTLQWSSLATNTKKSYIVYLGGHAHGLGTSEITDSHSDFLGSILGSKERVDEAMIYSYNKHINGFAAMLDEDAAAKIAEHPDVVSVFENKALKLHTTHSWEFLKLETNGSINPSSLWKKARFGENIIIANLDTGVWPESKSFSDHGYGAIPSKWKGGCQNQTSVPCNNKLIGAKLYNNGYINMYGWDPTLNSARDYEGHGSHTLSTAGGNFVPGVTINEIQTGTAKGGSPRARVAAYKVCGPRTMLGGECVEADILAGFEAAIEDGVDVISVSLGGEATGYFNDAMSIASFHAVRKGITVVFSAGNDGPAPGTVTNVSPWVITVGASTIDREFQSYVQLITGLRLNGLSMSKPLPEVRMHPVITGEYAKAENATVINGMLCQKGALDPKKVKGKILVCLRGENGRVDKGKEAAIAGAAGMILCNDKASGDEIIADPHVLPATHITYADGLRLYAYLNSNDTTPVAFISNPAPVVNIKPAPSMAAFSSRGPNRITPEILKPDITGPGVNIIAAYTQDSKPVFPYNIESGTSMSCPHVSGLVGLLKNLHPDWSPAAIKSAIMTTATTRDNAGHPMLDESKTEASPFSRGAGDISPNRAMDPGLVYDLSPNDYLDFLCVNGYNKTMVQMVSHYPYECPTSNNTILDFNYPSISVHNLSGTVTVSRKLKNVGTPGIYTVRVRNPVGISIDVEPKVLSFKKKGDFNKFQMTIKAVGKNVTRDHVFGQLIWSDGKHHVKSPIIVSVA